MSPSNVHLWHGQARFGLGWGWFRGQVGDHQLHAHHALQVVLAPRGRAIWTDLHGWQSYEALIIGPSQQHALAPGHDSITLVYLEPDSVCGRRLRSILRGGIASLTQGQRIAFEQQLVEGATAPDLALATITCPATMDDSTPRIDRRLEALLSTLDDHLERSISVAFLAEEAGMSVGHFQHRFKAQTGMPVRPYLRWRRLLRAMQAVISGSGLSDAACAAGFSDAAHFTRTMRRHFGITPGTLAGMRP